jgi:hypothetical protein
VPSRENASLERDDASSSRRYPAIILYMLKFSKGYPDRVTHNEPAVPRA